MSSSNKIILTQQDPLFKDVVLDLRWAGYHPRVTTVRHDGGRVDCIEITTDADHKFTNVGEALSSKNQKTIWFWKLEAVKPRNGGVPTKYRIGLATSNSIEGSTKMKLSNKKKRTFQPIAASTSSRKTKRKLRSITASAKITYDGSGPWEGTNAILYDTNQLISDIESILRGLGYTVIFSEELPHPDSSVEGARSVRVGCIDPDPESSPKHGYMDDMEYDAKQEPKLRAMREKLESLGYLRPDVWVTWEKSGNRGIAEPWWAYRVGNECLYDVKSDTSSNDSVDDEVDDELENFRMAYEDLPWDEYVEFIADYESDVAAKVEPYLEAKGLNSETSVQNGQGADIIYRDGEVVAQIDYEEELQTLGQLLIDNDLDIDKTAKAFADYVLGYVEG